MTQPVDSERALITAQPLLALIPLADCDVAQLDERVARLNLSAFAALVLNRADEPAGRPETHDETAWKQEST